jgi:hypothetical protein
MSSAASTGANTGAITYSVPGGNGVATIADPNNPVLTIVGAGTVTVTAHAAGVASTTAPNSVTRDLVVGKKDITITGATVGSKVYDGNMTLDPATHVSGVTFGGTVASIVMASGTTFNVTSAAFTDNANVGVGKATTLTVELTGAALTNYSLATPAFTGATGAREITARPITITPTAGQSRAYDGTNTVPTITHSITAGTLVDGHSLTGALTFTGTAVGVYSIGQGSLGVQNAVPTDVTGNYAITIAAQTFAITKAAVEPKAAPLTVRYSNTNPQTVDIKAAVQSYITNGTTGADPTYTVQAYTGANTNIITAGAAVADASLGVLSFTLNSENAQSGRTATIPVLVGGFTNYQDILVNVNVTLSERTGATVTVTAPTTNLGYSLTEIGDPSATAETTDSSEPLNTSSAADFVFTYYGTLANGTVWHPSSAPVTDKPNDPGDYFVVAKLVDTILTHAGSSAPEPFTITKADLSWDAAGTVTIRAYDGTTAATVATQPTLTGILSPGGTADAVTVSNGTVTFADADAGSGKVITVSGTWGIDGTHAWKYNAPASNPTFSNGTIGKKDISIQSVAITDKTYDNDAAVATASVTPTFTGQLASTAVTFAVSAAAITGGNHTVGSRPVSVTVGLTGAADTNYNLTNSPFTGTGATVNVVRADGAEADAPTVGERTANSIAVTSSLTHGVVTGHGAEQTVIQFARSNVNTAPAIGSADWVDGTAGAHTFTGLDAGTTYYFFARAKESANFATGAASTGAAGTTRGVPARAAFNPAASAFPVNRTFEAGAEQEVAVTWSGTVGGIITVSYTGTGGTSYPKSETAPINVGTYAVTVSTVACENFDAVTDLAMGNLVIDRAAGSTIAAFTEAVNITKTGTSIEVTTAPGLSTATGQTLEYARVAGTTTTPPGTGWSATAEFTSLAIGSTHTIFVRAAQSANYYAGTASYITVTTKRTPTQANFIRTIPTDHVYTGSAQGVGTVTGTAGMGTITVLYNGAAGNPTNAGTYTVTVTTAEGDDFLAATTPITLGTYTIAPKPVTIASAAHTKAYDGTTAANGATVEFSDASAAASSVTAAYANANAGAALNITNLTLASPNFVLSGQLPANGVTNTAAGITKASAPAGVTRTLYVPEDVTDTYEFDLTQLLPGLIAPMVFGTTPAISYGAVITTNTDGLLDEIRVNGTKLEIDVLSESADATALITVTITSQNFEDITSTITVTAVEGIPVTMTGTVASKVFDGNPVALTGLTFSEGVYADYVVDYEWSSTTAPSDAGSYTLTVRATRAGHAIADLVIPFSITQATVTVTALPRTAKIDTSLPTFGSVVGTDFSVSGYLGTDTFVTAPTAASSANIGVAGTYPITVSGGDAGANYQFNFVSGILTVTALSDDADVKTVTVPSGAVIGANTITATVPNATTSVIVALTVHADAEWALYSDIECQNEIANKTMSGLTVGSGNAAYVRVVAENGFEKVYTLTITRDTAPIIDDPGNGGGTGGGGSTDPEPDPDDEPDTDVIPDRDILDILNSGEPPVIDLSDMDGTVISGEGLQAIRENGEDVTVVLESGFTYIIIADSITEEAQSFNLAIEITIADRAVEIDGVKVPANSVVISPEMSGSFGFEILFTFTAAQLSDAGVRGNNVRLFYVDDYGNVHDYGRTKLNDDGSIEFTMSRASFYVLSEEAPEGEWFNIFSDLLPGDRYFAAIAFMAQHGYMQGYGDGTVGPEKTLTRAQFVTMLWNLEGNPEPENAGWFTDSNPGDWYHDAVQWAAENDITQGIGGGLFGPDRDVSRQEVMTLLYRYAVDFLGLDFPDDKPMPDYTDKAKFDIWAESAAKALADAGILTSDDAFRPREDATRGESAEMFRNLVRFIAGDI